MTAGGIALPLPSQDKEESWSTKEGYECFFYVLRTGCQWNALPRSLGASSTVQDFRYVELGEVYFTVPGVNIDFPLPN
jgi:hypothetical protein